MKVTDIVVEERILNVMGMEATYQAVMHVVRLMVEFEQKSK